MKERQTEHTSPSRPGIVFFGRIMANISHEFNNVITVISELAGLLKDLALMTSKGREIPPEKIVSISDNISRQVARGKHLISHMNRFSHSTDEPRSTVDLQQTVENMQVLTDRIFKCRQTGISVSAPLEEYSLTTDPFELRHILFSCLDRFLDASSPQVSVTLHRSKNSNESASPHSGTLEMQISGNVEEITDDFFNQFDAIKEQAAELNGRLICEQTESSALVRLIFPSDMDAHPEPCGDE